MVVEIPLCILAVADYHCITLHGGSPGTKTDHNSIYVPPSCPLEDWQKARKEFGHAAFGEGALPPCWNCVEGKLEKKHINSQTV